MVVSAMESAHDDMPGTVGAPDAVYPVVDSAELSPIRRRLLRRPRREIHEIPRQPPGTVLVFQLGDSYDLLHSNELRLDADIVVEAVAVAVVSMRHVLCDAVAYLPTADPRTCVTARARFHCWVTDPLLVVDAGCWDIVPLLNEHLVADRRMRFLAADCDPHVHWPTFHRNMTARLFAFHDLNPLIVPGLTAHMVDLALELQTLARPPRPRRSVEDESGPGPHGSPEEDGNPAFVPDNYTWETKRD
ncbi:MAG: hypothetical protein AUG44_09935 [Actinobacteria bacterium 13_1_20CM_3_71_11]|nr:MAG: hypothetical protein AUG44_09935 [Actinobacteria bacterium 13_1_20CM_3_71_11]